MSYMWARCEGCKEEHDSSDPAMKDKHRFCVATRAKENVMPLSEGPVQRVAERIETTDHTDGQQGYRVGPPAVVLKPGEDEMHEANRLVNGERQADYGTPRENYEGIAKVWSGILSPILKRDITPEEAALMMVGLKLQRQAMKHKRDNLVDAHGYLLVYAHIREGATK